MPEQQRLRIDDVLGVDLHHLQLGQQQVGRRERLWMHLKAIVELERMTHAEGPNEDVDLARVALVIEEETAVAMQVVEAPVGDVTELAEQALESPVLALLDHDVDITVASIEDRRARTVPVHAHRRAAQ